jgi:DnaJ-class molecular chaperone
MLIPYLLLGISSDATDAEIRSRYLALVKQYPPESAPERFQRITEAYESIRSQRRRISARLFGTGAESESYADQLALLAETLTPRRRRTTLQELFDMEPQCLKK